jgi:hypothetical protein
VGSQMNVVIILAAFHAADGVADERATLRGVVQGQKGGALAGAMVRIFAAKPRAGAGHL